MSLQSRLDALVTKIAEKNNKLYDLAEKNANKAQDLTATGTTAQEKYTSVAAVKTGLSETLTSANNYTDTEIANLDLSDTYIEETQKGQANGVAPLNGSAKISETYLPDTVLGQLEYQGTITAAAAATLPAASTANKGHYYVASENFTKGTDYKTGDWIVSNGTAWEKVDNTDAVSTVFGRSGNIVANAGDYNATQITFDKTGTTLTGTTASSAIKELDGKAEANEAAISNLNTSTSNSLATKLDKGTYTGNAGNLKSLIDTNTGNISSNDTDISNIMTELNTYYKTDGFGSDFADYAAALETAVHADLKGV
jgi:hypothetical protein